jgi:hypothetical protein
MVEMETSLSWFGHIERRPVDFAARRVDQIEDDQITRDVGRSRKTIREIIKKDPEINELDRNMIYDRTLLRNLIHVAEPTYWNKAWLLLTCCCIRSLNLS